MINKTNPALFQAFERSRKNNIPNRITFYDERNHPCLTIGNTTYKNGVSKRLAEYEDTGLSPEDVVKMQKDMKQLWSLFITLVAAIISILVSFGFALAVAMISGERDYGLITFAFIMAGMTVCFGYGLKWYNNKNQK